MLQLRKNISENLSSKIGAPPEQIELILTMFSIIPLSIINYFIKGKYPRLIYSLVLGVLLQYSIYGIGIIHTFISTISTYLFIQIYGRKKSAFYVLIGTFLYQSFLHIYRMIYDYGGWSIDDPTTIYMMTICKFSSLAFSYEDGGKDDSEMVNLHHRTYKVIDKPSLLEIFSFVYFYPTSIIGPSIEYKDFINFIEEKDCYSHLPYIKLISNGFLYFLFSFIQMGIYAFFSPKIPISYIGNKEFGNKNLLYKIAYMYIALIPVRAKYYSGWLTSYTVLIINGIAYTETKDDKTGKIIQSFEKGCYGSILYDEFGINPKFKLVEWNKTIHLWLKYNIFTRTINIDKKPFKKNFQLASLLTFIGSAIWHGYYPTYYFTFICLYFYQVGNEPLDRVGFYKYAEKNIVLNIVMRIVVQLMFNMIGIPFFNLEFKPFIQYLLNTNFLIVFMVLIWYSCVYWVKIPKKDNKKVEEKKVPVSDDKKTN